MSGSATVIDVTQPPYNAVGDGSTDDTAAIQAAIAAMAANSDSVLYFPQGTYKISQSLDFSQVPGGQFRVEGAGDKLSTIEVAANNTAAISFTGSGPTQPQIANLGFTVSDPSLTGTTAIKLSGTSVTSYMANANIANVSITGYATGIALTDCLTNSIGNVTVVSIPDSGTGVSLTLAGQTSLSNVVVGAGTAGSNATGFLVQGSSTTTSLGEGIFMTDCNANGPNIGLKIVDTHFGTVTGCSFTSCPGGAVVSSNTAGGIGTAAWSFSACEFNASAAAPAVLMDGLANYNQFTGCWEFGSQYGIQLLGGGNNVTGNLCSSPAPATFSIAEQVDGGARPFLNLIADNTVYLPIAALVAGSGSELGTNLTETQPSGTNAQAVACFAAGSLIATIAGAQAVERLRVGDRLRLADGGAAPVIWIGSRRVACALHPRPWDVHPVRIRQGAFGENLPLRDLVLSPDHAVALAGGLIPVRYLINDATVVQEAVHRIEYWHVELERHAMLLAEGLPAESYLDTGNRAAFANGGAAIDLHPRFARLLRDARACAPLAMAGPILVNARAALLRRALRLGHRMTADPALVVAVAGRAILPRRTRSGALAFDLPAGVACLRLRSRSAVPGHLRVADADHRRLGVAVAGLALDGRRVGLSDARLGDGWHAPEGAFRWTDGDAMLAVGGARRLTMRTLPLLRYWADPTRPDGERDIG
jgi:hypothetical protein